MAKHNHHYLVIKSNTTVRNLNMFCSFCHGNLRPELVLTSYLHGYHSDRLGKGLTGCAACCTGFSCNSLALSLFGGLSISLGFPFCIIKNSIVLNVKSTV